MLLVEKHIIKSSSPFFKEIDALAFISKNLYNSINYIVRQYYFLNNKSIKFKELYEEFKKLEAYKQLPAKVSNSVLFQVVEAWSSYFSALKSYFISPELFRGRPRPPRYKDKLGKNLLCYTLQAISKKEFKKTHKVHLSLSNICFPTKAENIKEVQIAPRNNHYEISVIYEKEVIQNDLNKDLYLGIDLGVNNLATLTSNKIGFQPILINGRPLKSINQFYNKTISNHQSALPKNIYTSKKINNLWLRRKNKIDNYLHKASKQIINLLLENQIGNLVIGYNPWWKQEQNHGKVNNQNFQYIPFRRFIDMLYYKAELQGINIIIHEESYTSKCSFLDNEEICKHDDYAGRRIKRGLFKSAEGRLINADVNGSYNILRKVIPEFIGNRGIGVMPLKLKISKK